MTVAGAYADMLACVEAQARAIELEDWDAFDRLIGERCELVDAAQLRLADIKADERDRAVVLIEEVVEGDAKLTARLREMRAELMEESARLRRLQLLAAAYASISGGEPEGMYFDHAG